MSRKKEVGKGIRALLSNIEQSNHPEITRNTIKELAGNAAYVPIAQIETNPYQPRQDFDNEELMELARSIKTFGLIQPVTLRSMGDSKFQLISGERRLRASKMTGLTEVPAFIRLANDQEMLEMALVENIQRTNLNAIEVAISYQRLMDECSLTHEELSNRVGKNRSTVTNYVRLLKLPPDIQAGIKEDKISMGHARSIAGLEDPVQQLDIYKDIILKQLSVRATESLVKQYGEDPQPVKLAPKISIPPELLRLQDKLSTLYGCKVEIQRSHKGEGRIVLKFNTDNELNNLLDLLDQSYG
ncbi:MAG TPA: ParB/RepB/Spo0J family partition protein [Saprospiraceae bacterium]|nr:ParB/RepB/Spo0J family partition protein [Saprospiraceae bacterium]